MEPIAYEDVAKEVYMSKYHFHRIFTMVTGISANAYLRNRRLSMAGEEVILTDRKIIDIALDYGYGTSESFTKAFLRYHGVTPSVARRAGAELKLFNRLLIKLQLEGGHIMDYRIEKREPFKLLTKVRNFSNEVIDDDANTEIPDFWKESIDQGVLKVLNEKAAVPGLYGVCGPVDKESSSFKYGIATELSSGDIPEGYDVWEVKPTTWAVFKCIGDSSDCIGDTWSRIFKEFLPSSEYMMLDDTDFEYYPEDGEEGLFCEIWIPVGKEK